MGMNLYVAGSVVVFAIVFAYLGWVFWSRAHETRVVQERMAEERRQQDAQTVDAMGGNRFDILSFYATDTEIEGGGSSDLCYSTSNAKTVTIDPMPDGHVSPAYERCVRVSPTKSTTYTLTASDGAGHTKSAKAMVAVR
jgi:hypothetical protein